VMTYEISLFYNGQDAFESFLAKNKADIYSCLLQNEYSESTEQKLQDIIKDLSNKSNSKRAELLMLQQKIEEIKQIARQKLKDIIIEKIAKMNELIAFLD
jgi:hypothetical protein